MFHPKLPGGSLRNWVRDDNEKGNHPYCRRHRCPDWVLYHRVHHHGCWERWERSGRNCSELRRMYICIHLNLALHLKPTTFQFRKKPETRISIVGRRVSVPVECMVLSRTIAYYWGVNIHEPLCRFAIADSNREPYTREIGRASLTARR